MDILKYFFIFNPNFKHYTMSYPDSKNKTIGSIPEGELKEKLREVFARMSGEKVISYLLSYHGDRDLLSRDMAVDMIRRDVVSYADLGLDYVDDYVPDSTSSPIDTKDIINP